MHFQNIEIPKYRYLKWLEANAKLMHFTNGKKEKKILIFEFKFMAN